MIVTWETQEKEGCMEAQEMLYKVTIKHRMGIGNTDNGLMESQALYFRDIGDVTFPTRLVNKLEHGRGQHNKDFTIVHIECLGSVQTTEVNF